MASLESFTAELNELAFFREFTFSKSTFPRVGGEVELADGIVQLSDTLVIFQMKERDPNAPADSEAMRSWFKNSVIKHATRQIRSSMQYLANEATLVLRNAAGDLIDLKLSSPVPLIKVILHFAHSGLPEDCASKAFHDSRSAGFIHVMAASDYLEVCRTLRVPSDIVDYFRYRERAARLVAVSGQRWSEPLAMGQYVSGDESVLPSMASLQFLRSLDQESGEFDISSILRMLRETVYHADHPTQYYQVLSTLAELPREVWREFKLRLRLGIEAVHSKTYRRPMRIAYPHKDLSVAFIPLPPERSDVAQEIRLNGLKNLTYANMYENRTSRGLGVSIAKDGEHFLLDWCLIVQPWEHDPEMDEALLSNNPFGTTREAVLQRFKFQGRT